MTKRLLYFPKLREYKGPYLPLVARLQLANAAKIDPDLAAGESEKRASVINQTVKNLRELYPSAYWPLDENGFALRY